MLEDKYGSNLIQVNLLTIARFISEGANQLIKWKLNSDSRKM